MGQAKRNEIEQEAEAGPPTHALARPPAADHGYHPGGPVAQLQADLARRLAAEGGMAAGAIPVSPAEPLVRFASVTGGYVMLAAGYAAVAAAIARWWW